VLDEDAGFLKAPRIDQKIDPLAGGEAPLRVKLGDALLAAARKRGLLARSQLFDRMATGQGLDLPAQGDGAAGSAILIETAADPQSAPRGDPRTMYNAASRAFSCMPRRSDS